MNAEVFDRASCALLSLLAACERIQSEQPARRFLAPPVAAEVRSLAAQLAALAPQPLALDQPDTPENCARFEAIGEAVAHEFALPRIRSGPGAGRYRCKTYGTKTAQGLGRIVARIVDETPTR